jgi:FMN reductase
MSDVLTIAGSPSHPSRSAAVLDSISADLVQRGLVVDSIRVRDLPAEDLLFARTGSDSIRIALDRVEAARTVIIATPIYKAAYSGILKAFLDLLPQNALRGKAVLPIATGGSLAHLLSIDYALKPVLGTLGATTVFNGVYLIDSQVQYTHEGSVQLEPDAATRLYAAVNTLVEPLGNLETKFSLSA